MADMNSFRFPIYVITVLFVLSVAGLNAGYTQSNTNKTPPSQRELVERVNQTVVQIIVDEFGRPSRFEQSGNVMLTRNVKNGSGVFVSSDGYIVTNRHVINEAETVQVLLPQPRTDITSDKSVLSQQGQILVADIIGSDSETDIAVLKVDVENHPHLNFGDSNLFMPAIMFLLLEARLDLKNR